MIAKVAYVFGLGQKMVRFYDLDGNLIEVRTPMEHEKRKEVKDELSGN